jgi:hypothetical protein
VRIVKGEAERKLNGPVPPVLSLSCVGMRISEANALAAPVRVTVRSKEECAGDAQLEGFRCSDGPAGREVGLIVGNLISGDALPQTVAFVNDVASGALLGVASVRPQGNDQLRGKSSTPWFVRRLATNPYVNVIARDERYVGRVLHDGRTRLGTAILRAGLEALRAELGGGALPTVFALVRRENEVSKRTFSEFAFYPHDRSPENQQDVYVRRAGRRLPPAPPLDAYIPLGREPEVRALKDARTRERSV